MSFIVIMISTEKALKKTFDKSGNKVQYKHQFVVH